MAKNPTIQKDSAIIEEENLVEIFNQSNQENNKINNLIKIINQSSDPAFLCSSDISNPNSFSIFHGNSKFIETFNLNANIVIGKEYDFLFKDIDIDSDSQDQIEYIRLIKAVRDFKTSEVVVNVNSHDKQGLSRWRCRVNFIPSEVVGNVKYGIFIFEKLREVEAKESVESNEGSLLKNLERMLRNERLLREIGYLLVTNLPIYEIAKHVAKILCDYLKVDRCLITDMNEQGENFIVEHSSSYVKPMVAGGIITNELLKKLNKEYRPLRQYLDFQRNFHGKIALNNNSKNTSNKTNFAIVVEDTSTDSNFLKISSLCEEFSIYAQASITTSINKEVNGCIYVHQSEVRSWIVSEIELLEMVAEQFSLAIDRAKFFEKLKITNQELVAKTEQLNQALEEEKKIRKMQNEFVTLISHEFKTPLQIIDSTRELIERKIKQMNLEEESITRYCERIKTGVTRMSNLINSSLNLAKLENNSQKFNIEKNFFNFHNFLQEIAEKNRHLAVNKNIKVELDITQCPQELYGDSKILDHVFTNITANAVKYSKDNSAIKIRAFLADEDVVVDVIDNGIGIPQEDLQNIGKKFFRASNTLAVSGTGIGLYLSKHFIEMHNGKIEVTSQINIGSTISIFLPNIKRSNQE